jgi:hypothetical protein
MKTVFEVDRFLLGLLTYTKKKEQRRKEKPELNYTRLSHHSRPRRANYCWEAVE